MPRHARQRAQLGDRRVIGLEQPLVRIVAMRELEQQLVQVEGGEKAGSAQGQRRYRGLGGLEGLQLATPEPVERERLERHQDAAARGLWTPRALGHQADAAVMLRPGLQDEAGLPVRVGVEDVAAVDGQYPSWRSAISLSAQPLFTFTQSSRCTRPSKSASIACRASVPMRLSVAPFSPITMALCPGRST